jgi:uncharacterized protein YukE
MAGVDGEITYVHGSVADLASQVGTYAAQLMEIHDDVLNRTQAIQEFFTGVAASQFHATQMQILHGLDGLIQTVMTHGTKIGESNDLAHALDVNLGTTF